MVVRDLTRDIDYAKAAILNYMEPDKHYEYNLLVTTISNITASYIDIVRSAVLELTSAKELDFIKNYVYDRDVIMLYLHEWDAD